MNYTIVECTKHKDPRGYLVEFLRGAELVGPEREFGQIYFVTFDRPNQVRGNHYHTQGIEWFGVAHGHLEVVLEDVSTKERVQLFLSSDDASFLRLTVGPYVAHAFRNLSPTAILLDYTTEQFNRAQPDRHVYELIPPGSPPPDVPRKQ